MSDILIKGMEMPTGGRILIVFPSGRVLEVSADATQNIFRETQAFPVPPHGRLGDLDAVEAEIREKTNEQFCVNIVHTAPTIIPAEEVNK